MNNESPQALTLEEKKQKRLDNGTQCIPIVHYMS